MNKMTRTMLVCGFAISALPMLAVAGGKLHGGTPHALAAIQQQLSDINGKIDSLDSDNDNPLLGDILAEIQGLRGDVSSMSPGGTGLTGLQQGEGLLTSPVTGTDHDLVTINGSGSFVAARLTKQGGATNLTTVELVIDGKTVVGRTYAALDNWGMTQNNPYGLVLLHGNGVDAVTIGFQQPVKFNTSLVLRTHVGESGIVQMIGTVIYGQ